MARQFLNITYPNPDHPDYKRVIELVKEHDATKSDTGRRLVHRGLEHLGNPHPLFGDPEASSLAKATIRERKPVVRAVNPIVNSSVEHVSGEQDPSELARDQEQDRKQADRKSGSAEALDKKKSPEEGKSSTGWIILGLLGAGIATWVIRRFTS